MNWFGQWHPKIIDTQLLQIGNILIAAMPGEITTMAGRLDYNIFCNLFKKLEIFQLANLQCYLNQFVGE